MTARRIHYRRTTAQQRKLLFEKWEETGDVSEACRKAHVGRGTFYYWQARFRSAGYEGLEEFESHAPSSPNRMGVTKMSFTPIKQQEEVGDSEFDGKEKRRSE